MFSKLSKISGWYRVLTVFSVVWVIFIMITKPPWTTSYRYYYREDGIRRIIQGSGDPNWDNFLTFGIMPIILLWGIIWIVRGFRKNKKLDSDAIPISTESFAKRKAPPKKENNWILTTSKKCPKCGSRMLVRSDEYGKFYCCSGFPECHFFTR